MSPALEKNVVKIYAFKFSWMSLIIIPVIVPYFQSHGLTMHQFYLLQVVFAAIISILEVPSGYLSDLWGRKKTLVLGSLISGLAFIVLFFAKGFWGLAIFEVLQAIGLSLVSGTDVAILYDSIDPKEHLNKGKKMMSNVMFFSAGAEAIASVIGGWLAAISFTHMLIAQVIVGWIPFFIALTVVEPPFEKMNKSETLNNFKQILGHLFTGNPLLKLSFINLVFWSQSTFLAIWVFQKHWENNGVLLGYFGMIWSGYQLTTALASWFTHRVERVTGQIPLLILMGVLPLLGYLSMAFFSIWWAIALGVGFSIARSIKFVILNDIINNQVPGKFRATANSLANLMFRLSFCILGPAVGFSIDKIGVPKTMFGLAMVFLFFGLFLLPPLLRHLQAEKT